MSIEVNIKNHSEGSIAGVTSSGQLKVQAETLSLQHFTSHQEETAFQVLGQATIINGTATVLHIKNTHSSRDTAITYIRAQIVDPAATVPAAATYLQVGVDELYASGGTAVTPTNMNRKSGKTASMTCYDNAPTMSGTFTEIDRYHFIADGDSITYDKEASLITGPGDTVSLRIISGTANGSVQARISFLMLSSES